MHPVTYFSPEDKHWRQNLCSHLYLLLFHRTKQVWGEVGEIEVSKIESTPYWIQGSDKNILAFVRQLSSCIRLGDGVTMTLKFLNGKTSCEITIVFILTNIYNFTEVTLQRTQWNLPKTQFPLSILHSILGMNVVLGPNTTYYLTSTDDISPSVGRGRRKECVERRKWPETFSLLSWLSQPVLPFFSRSTSHWFSQDNPPSYSFRALKSSRNLSSPIH